MDLKLDISLNKTFIDIKKEKIKEAELPKLDLKLNEEEKIPEKIPSLYDINKSFDVIKVKNHDGIVGEYAARMVIFTSFILGKNCVLLIGSRASGKTCLMNIIGTYAQNPGDIRKSSDKADYRDSDLNKFSHFIIPEINKISDSFTEVLKDIGEGEVSIYKTLNDFKMPIVYRIEPKPFISSVADENPNSSRLGEELISRLITIRTDASIEQNMAVMKYKLKRAQNPFYRKDITQKDIFAYQNYVKNLPNMNEFVFVYLPGESVIKAVPPFFSDARRDIQKYIMNTYGITLFHHNDRMIVEKKNKKLMLVTPADAWYNHIIFNEIIVQSSLKCSGMEKIILKILSSFDAEGNKVILSYKELHDLLVRQGYTPSLPTIKKYCQNLYENGYVVRHEEKKPFTYESGDFFKDFMASVDWKEVVSECKRAVIEQFDKEIAEDYIRRYCTEPIIVTSPFSGENINLLDYKEPTISVIEQETEKTEENEIKVEKKLSDFEENNNDISESIEEKFEDNGDEEENNNGKKGKDGRDYVKFMIEEADDKGLVDSIKFDENFGEDYANKLTATGLIFEPKRNKYKTLD